MESFPYSIKPSYQFKKQTGKFPRKTDRLTGLKQNFKLDEVIRIAKTMRDAKSLMAIQFEGTVKEIIGTCVSRGKVKKSSKSR